MTTTSPRFSVLNFSTALTVSELRGLNIEKCTEAFARGDVAVMIGGVEIATELMESPHASQAMRDNVGVTTLPGVPWIGGDHLVVWKNVLTDAKHERAALELVRFLSKRETQIQLFNLEGILPARADAYDELTFPLETTAPTVQRILKTGHPHLAHPRLLLFLQALSSLQAPSPHGHDSHPTTSPPRRHFH